MIGTTEIVVIAATGMVLFGASALPKFARSIGQAKKELEKGMKEGYDVEDDSAEVEDSKSAKKSKSKK
ncbi:MAG: twin-arginine translocase TatA/TatE family subunit [Spirochaetales bacterium]|nr:twin-arginine translocase TatA/TatE family subunit [Spirochaetales bacterium]